jgi:hypothetical protein
MSSLRQIEANRRNSLRSTGPRTPEGKATSRLNALKSGINAKLQVIPGEDPADLQAMSDGYTHEWAPKTYLERFLVDSLVRADWLLQRLSRLEAELWTHEIEAARALTFSKLDEDSPIGDVYSRNCDAFTRFQRRIDSTERSYYRALTQLRRLRQGLDRGEGPAPEPGRPPLEDSTSPSAPPPERTLPPAAPELASFRQSPDACCFRKNPAGLVAEMPGRCLPQLFSLKAREFAADWLLGNLA